MNGNTDGTGRLENDNRFIGLEVFKAMENNGPTENDRCAYCFGKSRSIVFRIVLLASILLICILLIIIVCVFNSITFRQLKTINMQVSEFQQHAVEEQDNLKTKVANLSGLMENICTMCPTGWHAAGSSCYYFSEEQVSWIGAREECYKVDSVLAMIKNRKKSDSLNTFFNSNRQYWIGLIRDPRNIHIWKWIDGTEVTFTNWGVNQPNFLNWKQHCAETWSGPWNDENCDVKLNYICEKNRIC